MQRSKWYWVVGSTKILHKTARMAYNTVNKLLFYKKVINLVQQHYIPEVTTYKGIYVKYINPEYPMSYKTFMKIMATPVDKELKELLQNQ